MGKPLTQLGAVYFLDWFTTWLLMELGGSEGNPFLEGFNSNSLLALKVLVAGLVLLLWKSTEQWTTPAYWTRLAQVAVVWFSLVNLWNVGRIGILLEQTAAGLAG